MRWVEKSRRDGYKKRDGDERSRTVLEMATTNSAEMGQDCLFRWVLNQEVRGVAA